MVRGNILGELAIKILKPDRELGDCFLWFLAYGVELSEQFSLRDFAMEELEELSADVLECRELPQVMARIPLSGRSIEGQCEFHDFRGLDLSDCEPLC